MEHERWMPASSMVMLVGPASTAGPTPTGGEQAHTATGSSHGATREKVRPLDVTPGPPGHSRRTPQRTPEVRVMESPSDRPGGGLFACLPVHPGRFWS